MINDILPKPQYSRKFREDEKEGTIIDSFFKNNEWKPADPCKKNEACFGSRQKVKSMHYQEQSKFKDISNAKKRERMISYAEQPPKKDESSINDIAVFREVPGS